jgi:putative drug exporter of the RND superfamily
MFAAIGRFDVRFRWLIVAVWVAGVIAGVRLAPGLSSVTQPGNSQFLSSSAPSVRAAMLATPFQGRANASATAVIVASRASGPLTAADQAATGRVEQAARRVPGVVLVRDEGTSPDGHAAQALVTVTAKTAGSDVTARTVVDAIRASFPGSGAAPGLALHLTGPLAVTVDASSTHAAAITRFTLLFVIVLLFVVYRAVLAPLITLIPAFFAVLLAQPLVAEAGTAGLSLPTVAQQLLIVLLLGAGTDYGLFLAFRMREEIRGGTAPRQALVTAVTRVGQAISYSALTVAAALLTLLLSPFAIYRGLGPALAIGIVVLLAASLTLTPALLAIAGRAVFWPARPRIGPPALGLWGRVAEGAVARPVATLAAGLVLFGALAAGLAGYRTSGLTSPAPPGSDSAAGQAVLAAHFPKASVGADQLLLRYAVPVWDHPSVLAQAQARLAADPVFASVTGPLGPGRGMVPAARLAALHQELGPAAALPAVPSPSSPVPPTEYQAYRATAQFISPDGRTIQYYATLHAGPVGSPAAASAIPQAQAALDAAARTTGAQAHGVAGQDASAHDILGASTASLEVVIPVVLVLILFLLGLLLRSLVAPWYLAATVGLSYLASLGFAMTVFVHLGHSGGLIFVLPLLMFVFSMALGEDYNILVMTRIREEAHHAPSLRAALAQAVGLTGSTVTSAGLILAGTFTVLGLAGGNTQAQQLGFAIAFGVLLDTFFVRTLLVPAIARLAGRWNWWPSALSRQPADAPGDFRLRGAAGEGERPRTGRSRSPRRGAPRR